MMDLAFDREDQTLDMMAALEKVREGIQQRINFRPEDAEFDDEDESNGEDDFFD